MGVEGGGWGMQKTTRFGNMQKLSFGIDRRKIGFSPLMLKENTLRKIKVFSRCHNKKMRRFQSTRITKSDQQPSSHEEKAALDRVFPADLWETRPGLWRPGGRTVGLR